MTTDVKMDDVCIRITFVMDTLIALMEAMRSAVEQVGRAHICV